MKRRRFLTVMSAAPALPQQTLPLSRDAAGSPCPQKTDKGGMTGVMPIIIIPEWGADSGKRYDPAAFVKYCREANVQCIEFEAKNSQGHAMFPFRGRSCPTDWNTETRRLAREGGLTFFVYYSIGMDNLTAEQHPEWACVDGAGKPIKSYGFEGNTFYWLCFRTPWRDVVIDEIRQVTEALRPEGLWLDQAGAPNSYGGRLDPESACHCRYCRAAYLERNGKEMPATSEDPAVRLAIYRLAEDARVEMLRDIVRAARKIVPDIALSYNFAGAFWERLQVHPDLAEVECAVTRNSIEAKTHTDLSMNAKMLGSAGKAFELTSYGHFQTLRPGTVTGTWVDWNLLPASYLEVSAAVTAAHGGRFTIGINPLPDGTLYEAEFRNVSSVFSAVRERESWLTGLRSVPSIGILYDSRSELAGRLARPATGMISEVRGLHDALLAAGVHFDIVRTNSFAPREYQVLLAGNVIAPPHELLELFREFVSGGGLLLATDETSLRGADGRLRNDFEWSSLLGVRFVGISPFQEANWAWVSDELRGPAPRYPVLFTAPTLKITCTTARPLATTVHPEARWTPKTALWEAPYNHFKQFTQDPLITLNRVGRGAVVYIAGPIGRQIAQRNDPWLKHIISAAVKKYAAKLAAELTAPPGIQVVLGRRPESGGHVVSLVNHYAGMTPGSPDLPRPQVGPIRLRVPLSVLGGPPSAVKSIDIEGLQWRVADDTLVADARSVGVHGLLILT
jgi:hypothetical protein